MIRIGISGSTGYVGNELLRLLSSHPEVRIESVTSRSYAGKAYYEVFEGFRHRPDIVCEEQEEDLDEMAERCDAVFIALPHGLSSGRVTERVLSKTKVIDIGADFRMQDVDVYEKWYATPHNAKHLVSRAVYGLCEINRKKIKNARLVANPGCYSTCSILSLYPLLKEGAVEADGLIVDAISGVSGAGRGLELGLHFCEADETVKAYKIASHRHTPEIEEQLAQAAGKRVTLTFTPHLAPMSRGILATCYAKLAKGRREEDIRDIYSRFYGDEYFVRLTKPGFFPETRWVKASNFCDIGFAVDERTGRVIVVGALDNLVKGAAGQAVQNMNILFGLDERTGLDSAPVFPG